MKNDRHAKILELIEQYPIDRQEDLLAYLNEAGFSVTQATVSRDIRQLHLIKAAVGGGKYRYVSSVSAKGARHSQGRFETIFRESVLKADWAGCTVMVRCYPGMASAACELFDSMQWDCDVIGTLSGDDTFLALMRTPEAAQAICAELQQYITRH